MKDFWRGVVFGAGFITVASLAYLLLWIWR